jgi:zinc-ribbon domain
MYCSRCGTQNEPGDRFCSSCGASLAGKPSGSAQGSARERLQALLGTTRRTRLVTVATVVALVVAVIAFIELKPAHDDSIPRDAYTIAADHMCVSAKRKIVATERQALRDPSVGSYPAVSQLVLAVSNWRSEFEAMAVPTDRTQQARTVAESLREAEIQLSGLSLATERGDQSRAIADAKKVDQASSEVERATAALGLSRCAQETIAFSGAAPG